MDAEVRASRVWTGSMGSMLTDVVKAGLVERKGETGGGRGRGVGLR